jgi:hypothetical protein
LIIQIVEVSFPRMISGVFLEMVPGNFSQEMVPEISGVSQ